MVRRDEIQLKLLADAMLGSLARKLRLLGFDTAYAGDADGNELKYLVRSKDLILITRDLTLAGSLGERAWVPAGSDVEQEFRSIAGNLALFRHQLKPFSRCIDCNVTLESADAMDAEGMVPPYIFQRHKKFSRCPSCRRIFWGGTHRERMEKEVEWMVRLIVRG
ncbi:MAG: Mut7-C RNAse domain-containing protein [Pseudomonadota bacterium]|jgi:uncharacterized protein with PIN domain